MLKLEIPVPEEVDKYRKMLQKNRIFRLFYRGQSFEKGYMYAEAFVLYSKVIELASPDNDPQIMDLVKKAQSRQLMVQAASFLETESSKTTRHSSFSALENPEVFSLICILFMRFLVSRNNQRTASFESSQDFLCRRSQTAVQFSRHPSEFHASSVQACII